MKFNDFIITDIGFSNVNAAVINEKDITFKKLVTGTGSWEVSEIPGAKELKEPKQEILISKVEILDDKTVRCLATISNAGLTESYCIKEVGVYIESDGGETLYSISTAKDEIEMPLELEVGMYQINFNFYQKISTGDINIRVANEAYVSTEDFEPVSKAVDEMIDNVNIDQRDSGCDYIFSQIKFLNDNFIAISNSGRWASISTNGENWEGTIVSGKYIYDITYGAGLYVSVGQEIMTSSDGKEWTKRGTISEGSLLKVIYENNRFLAVGDWGLMMSSLDGIVWETIQVPTGENLREVIYEKQLYLAAGNKNTILYSLDGIQWSVAETDPNLKPNVGKIIYKNNIFVALCGDYAGYSEDGIHWSIASEFRARMNDICFGNGLFVACGAAGAIYTSQDGKTWNESPYPYPHTDSDYFYEITYGNEIFITVGSQGKIATSPDGINWIQRIAPYNGYLNCVGYAKNIFVIGGNEGKLITCDHSKYKKMEDMKQQISELNSALLNKQSYPDYSKISTIISGGVGTKTYTCTKNGFVQFVGASGNNSVKPEIDLSINGVYVFKYRTGYQTAYVKATSGLFPVKQGDVIKCVIQSSFVNDESVRFYQLRY